MKKYLNYTKISINTKTTSSFVLSLINLIWMNKKCFYIAIFHFIWTFLSKKIIRKSSMKMDAVLKIFGSKKQPKSSSLVKLVLYFIAECLSKSVVYWIKPIFEVSFINNIELLLFRKCLNLSFERFFNNGPALNNTKISRHSTSITKSAILLVFDVIGNVVGMYSSLDYLIRILELKMIFIIILCIILATFIEIKLFKNLEILKDMCIESNELKAKNMTECFENIFLLKITNTNEHDRLNSLFSSDAKLKYSILTSLLKWQNKVLCGLSNIYVVIYSKSIKNSPISMIRELYNLSDSFGCLLKGFFKLESKRIKTKDLELVVFEKTERLNKLEKTDMPLKITLIDLSIFVKGVTVLNMPFLELLGNQKIALVGDNGTGKTTFLKFLLGFYKYTGIVKVNNNIINDMENYLIPSISYLPQNNFLVGTIYEILRSNISSDEEMIKISKKFGAHEFIKTLPDGYRTSVNDLSESQRQIIKIIKSCSKKASILLADEPAYCISDEKQDKLLDIILSNPNQKSKLVIIHQMNQLYKFDLVFNFKNGGITIYKPLEYIK